MRSYVLLKKINVQNANTIAGLTYGFPAITNFLGFAHGLSRKLSNSLNVELGGVCIISHENQVRVVRPNGFGDSVFSLTRNPLTKKAETAPVNEEGRMNMQVSLLIEISGPDLAKENMLSDIKNKIFSFAQRMRLAGGQIISINSCELLLDNDSQKRAIRRLSPGVVLLDRSDYLEEHFKNLKKQRADASVFDAWCDFSKLKYRAVPFEGENRESKGKATWHYIPKPTIENPKPGYLVPIASGYYAVSELHNPGEVDCVRDKTVPVAFAEIAYSVGEWRGVCCIGDINNAVWKFSNKHPWYLAQTDSVKEDVLEPDTTVL